MSFHCLHQCYAAAGIQVFTCQYWWCLKDHAWSQQNRMIYREFANYSPDKFKEAAEQLGVWDELKEYRRKLRSRYDHDVVFRKYETTDTSDIVNATRTGRMDIVQRLIQADPSLLNTERDDMTLVYHAAFCGHTRLLEWLLFQGGTADWDRTLINSPDRIRPIIKRHMRENAAAMCIQRCLHSWLWDPVTKDGMHGINARLLVQDLECIENTATR